jgi:hypothetical protein
MEYDDYRGILKVEWNTDPGLDERPNCHAA